MAKANRICHCCGQGYYYCPSCPDDRRDPRIYIMWDSEKCRDIFNVLVDESTKKITTLECKTKLIELGVNKNTVLKDSVRKHVDRVLSYNEIEKDAVEENIVAMIEIDPEPDVKVLNEVSEETGIENAKKIIKTRTRRSSVKPKENSEVD